MARTFFGRLHEQGYEPLLKRVRGTIELIAHRPEGENRWVATIRDGEIGMTRQEIRTDACMEASAALFDALSDGRRNAIAATLRGDLVVTGDLRLVLQLTRLLPGPPQAHGPRYVGRKAAREHE